MHCSAGNGLSVHAPSPGVSPTPQNCQPRSCAHHQPVVHWCRRPWASSSPRVPHQDIASKERVMPKLANGYLVNLVEFQRGYLKLYTVRDNVSTHAMPCEGCQRMLSDGATYTCTIRYTCNSYVHTVSFRDMSDQLEINPPKSTQTIVGPRYVWDGGANHRRKPGRIKLH